MRIQPFSSRAWSLVALAMLVTVAAQARNLSLPETKPESVGFSSERLKRLDAGMRAVVDSKQLAGIATVVARRGQVVQQMTYGQADTAGGKPMQMDSIVRIYSMTKPITGVAMMMLYEEGKWKPSDPISRHIPEFKDLKVFAGNGPDGQPTFVAPAHAPTMGEPEGVKSQNGKFGIGNYRMQPGFGFGFDVAIYEEPLAVGSPTGKGTYLWDGLAGTWFWIDPTNEVVFLGIIQRRGSPPSSPNIEDLSRQLTFQALVEPSK